MTIHRGLACLLAMSLLIPAAAISTCTSSASRVSVTMVPLIHLYNNMWQMLVFSPLEPQGVHMLYVIFSTILRQIELQPQEDKSADYPIISTHSNGY